MCISQQGNKLNHRTKSNKGMCVLERSDFCGKNLQQLHHAYYLRRLIGSKLINASIRETTQSRNCCRRTTTKVLTLGSSNLSRNFQKQREEKYSSVINFHLMLHDGKKRNRHKERFIKRVAYFTLRTAVICSDNPDRSLVSLIPLYWEFINESFISITRDQTRNQ